MVTMDAYFGGPYGKALYKGASEGNRRAKRLSNCHRRVLVRAGSNIFAATFIFASKPVGPVKRKLS
jgi:hypothetical protein